MKHALLLAGLTVCASAAFSAGLTAKSYVQDGLVVQLDAIDNEGTGTHNPTATKWKAVKGTAYVNVNSGCSWLGGRYFLKSDTVMSLYNMPAYCRTNISCDVAINVYSSGTNSAGSYPRIYANAESFSIYFDKNNLTNAYFYMDKQTGDHRPPAGVFRSGTLSVFSDATHYGVYNDGVFKNQSNVPATNLVDKAAATWSLGYAGYVVGAYGAFRLYNRALSAAEIEQNVGIDKLRYFSFLYTGSETETTVPWADISWTKPDNATAEVPQTATATDAVVLSKAAVSLSESMFLKALSLEDGATIEVPEGVVLSVNVLYVEGVKQKRGIYAVSAAKGRAATWLTGAGVVRVADSLNATAYPTTFLQPDAQGVVTLGLATGSSMTHNSIVGERPNWADLSVPDGTTLKLVGGVLLDEVPAGLFAAYDTTELKNVMCTGPGVFLDGSALVIPKDCVMRHLQPASMWKLQSDGKTYKNSSGTTYSTLKSDLVINGKLSCSGNSGGDKAVTFEGKLSGTGTLHSYDWGNGQAHVSPLLDFNGIRNASYPGNLTIFRADRSTGRLSSVTMSAGSSGKWKDNLTYYFHPTYCNMLLAFGPRGTTTTEGEFTVGTLAGNGHVKINPNDNSRWRVGGAVLVWGGNTFHVERLTAGGHFVGDIYELGMKDWLAGKLCGVTFGVGNVVIDECAVSTGYPTLYLSTNVNMRIGKVTNATTFDWTFGSGVANRRTFDITGACNAASKVVANDLAMLPCRLSGFTGTVALTNATEGVAYAMPIDFSVGPTGLYNTVGCAGSGTLVQAPKTATLNVTFDAAKPIPYGKYALARFTAGGECLSDWAVTLNGSATQGMSVGGVDLVVKRDSTGLWLHACRPGSKIIVR